MTNIYSILRESAKSIRAQNIFTASKEIFGIKIFRNSSNFSKLQEIYLSWLYSYDLIHRDLITEKISKHVMDNELFEDAYLMWRRENKYKADKSDKKQKDVNLIVGKKIIFPKKEDK